MSELSILWKSSTAIVFQSLNTLVTPIYFWGLFKISHFKEEISEGDGGTQKPLSEWDQTACKFNLKARITFFELEFTIFMFHLITMVVVLTESQICQSLFVNSKMSKREFAKIVEEIFERAFLHHQRVSSERSKVEKSSFPDFVEGKEHTELVISDHLKLKVNLQSFEQKNVRFFADDEKDMR